MLFVRRLVVTLACAVLIAAVIDLAAPKAVHGLVAALVTVSNTSSNPVPIAASTHLGVKPSQFVTLNCFAPTFCEAIDPYGNGSGSLYTVPAGNYLVVTDFDWLIGLATPGALGSVELSNPGLNRTELTSVGTVMPNGTAWNSEHLTSGIIFASAPVLVLNEGEIIKAHVHGYLTPIQ